MIVRCGTDSVHGLQIFRAGMKEEMHVRVNQAGEKSGVAEIDHFRSGGVSDFCADFFYGVAFDRGFRRGDDAAGFYVEQACSVEDDQVRAGRRLRLR